MSGIHPDGGPPGIVHRSSFLVYRPSLQNLLSLTRTCRTPSGHIKILQNSTGGNLILTSSSKRLFQSLSIKKPIIQLLVASAQGHLSAYSDGGLFLTTFATDLILRSLDSKQNIKILAEIYETFLTFSLAYMSSDTEACWFKYSASMSDIKFMTSYVRSVLYTKPLCCFYDSKLDFLSRLVLETFLQSISDKKQTLSVSENVFTVCTAGAEVTESSILEGLLLLAPEFSRFKSCNIKPKYVDRNKKQLIIVAMVTVSLSGDLEELSGIDFEISQSVSVDDVVLDELLEFCDHLIQSRVGLVLCQKVVHPRLKLHMQSAGVIVVDRLGIQSVKFVTNLTGCIPINSVTSAVSSSSFGYIDSVQHTILNKKSYLHLSRTGNSVVTVLLFNQEEQALQELKDIFMTSLESLQQLLYSPSVLAGAGCWQAGLASYLLSKVHDDLADLCSDLECPASVIKEACQMFCQALWTAAGISPSLHSVSRSSGHVFRLLEEVDTSQRLHTCCCGIDTSTCMEELTPLSTELDSVSPKFTKSRNSQVLSDRLLDSRHVVMDGFSMCMNALQTAVLTACTALKIGQVVENLS